MEKKLLQAAYLLFAGSLLILGCKKNNRGVYDPLAYAGIKKITANEVENTDFAYENGALKSMKHYSMCKDVPANEEEYYYSGSVLNSLKIKTNVSSSTNCASAQIVSSDITFVYDNQKRISKVINGTTSYKIYTYDGNSKWVTRQISYNTATDQPFDTVVFKRDNAGNIIETIESTGSTFYKYDNKVNPFYVINKSPWFVSAWHNSPNNVIEQTNASGTVKRTITAYENNLPVKVLETNGITYTYGY